jgi:hypothetical protein
MRDSGGSCFRPGPLRGQIRVVTFRVIDEMPWPTVLFLQLLQMSGLVKCQSNLRTVTLCC